MIPHKEITVAINDRGDTFLKQSSGLLRDVLWKALVPDSFPNVKTGIYRSGKSNLPMKRINTILLTLLISIVRSKQC